MVTRKPVKSLSQVENNKFYRVADLQEILKYLGDNFSIFSIMNAETWKCQNYDCGKRYKHKVDRCLKCGAPVTEPIIPSPRTRGGGRGVGHRRYSGQELKKIVSILTQ